MNDLYAKPIGDRFDDDALIDAALKRAAREAVLQHARAGNPVATLREEKVVWLQPAEVFALLADSKTQSEGGKSRRPSSL
jgi:hypothetical protein